MEIVDLWHVSEEDVSLAAEDGGQKPDQSRVVHLSPVSLHVWQLAMNAKTMLVNLLYEQQEVSFYFPLTSRTESSSSTYIRSVFRSSLITWLRWTKRAPEGIVSTEQKESQNIEHQEAAPRINRHLPLTASAYLGCPPPPGCRTRSFGSPGNRESPRSEHTRDGVLLLTVAEPIALPSALAAECDLNIDNKCFWPYFSGIGTLSGDSLPRQREIKREFQTIACKRKNINHRSRRPSKSIIYMQLVFIYSDAIFYRLEQRRLPGLSYF